MNEKTVALETFEVTKDGPILKKEGTQTNGAPMNLQEVLKTLKEMPSDSKVKAAIKEISYDKFVQYILHSTYCLYAVKKLRSLNFKK